jgi:hypothetical protein
LQCCELVQVIADFLNWVHSCAAHEFAGTVAKKKKRLPASSYLTSFALGTRMFRHVICLSKLIPVCGTDNECRVDRHLRPVETDKTVNKKTIPAASKVISIDVLWEM